MTSPQAEGRATVGHTPGPWDCTGCMFPDDALGGVYYRVQAEGMDARGANARLIAAAPELLEALEGLLAHPGTHHSSCIHWHTVGCDCEFSEVANAARDAIAKARGQ